MVSTLKITGLLLVILAYCSCHGGYTSQLRSAEVSTLSTSNPNNDFLIHCKTTLMGPESKAELTSQSEPFQWTDLSTNRAATIISIPPYILKAQFIDINSGTQYRDETFCSDFFLQIESDLQICQNPFTIGNLIKANQMNFPFYTGGSKIVDLIYEQKKIERIDYECLLHQVTQ
jgi:hypothetical protein